MKVCYKAGAVTAQNHYYSIAADAVEIRVWFLTDDIIRIRAGFDGDWDEFLYRKHKNKPRRITKRNPARFMELVAGLEPATC